MEEAPDKRDPSFIASRDILFAMAGLAACLGPIDEFKFGVDMITAADCYDGGKPPTFEEPRTNQAGMSKRLRFELHESTTDAPSGDAMDWHLGYA